jgi:hypothetical protein
MKANLADANTKKKGRATRPPANVDMKAFAERSRQFLKKQYGDRVAPDSEELASDPCAGR